MTNYPTNRLGQAVLAANPTLKTEHLDHDPREGDPRDGGPEPDDRSETPEDEQVEPTDESRVAGIRQIIHALNIAIREAERAKLCVELELSPVVGFRTSKASDLLSIRRISREIR